MEPLMKKRTYDENKVNDVIKIGENVELLFSLYGRQPYVLMRNNVNNDLLPIYGVILEQFVDTWPNFYFAFKCGNFKFERVLGPPIDGQEHNLKVSVNVEGVKITTPILKKIQLSSTDVADLQKNYTRIKYQYDITHKHNEVISLMYDVIVYEMCNIFSTLFDNGLQQELSSMDDYNRIRFHLSAFSKHKVILENFQTLLNTHDWQCKLNHKNLFYACLHNEWYLHHLMMRCRNDKECKSYCISSRFREIFRGQRILHL